MEDHVNIVKFLIDMGANISIKDTYGVGIWETVRLFKVPVFEFDYIQS